MSAKIYMFECWECNEPVIEESKNPTLRAFCDSCREEHMSEMEKVTQEYVHLKTKVSIERAIRKIEKQGMPINLYKDAAEVVSEFALKDPTKFDSSAEMMAAMELIRNEIPIKMQYKVNRRRVDILIESLKIALEIDGRLHDFSVKEDSMRDVEILNELGPGWEIVRIPVKHIEKNLVKLVPAIKAIRARKQRIRRENNGFITKGFSRRDKALHEMVDEQIANDV